MELSGSYVIRKGRCLVTIKNYEDLIYYMELGVFSDLSDRGKEILKEGLSDDESKKYIEKYLSNKQVQTYDDGFISVHNIMTMLDNVPRKDIADKMDISLATLSKVARGWRNMNPDKRPVQITELRNIRFDTILKLSHYYHEYYRGERRMEFKARCHRRTPTINVGDVYACQNCGFNVTGSRYCPNCGVKINYN